MNEASLYTHIQRELKDPLVISKLGLGTMPGRLVKPRDGFGINKHGMVRVSNPIDLLYVTDCIEVKIVKARTERGMVFRPSNVDGTQLEEMRKHNAYLAVGFVLDGKDKPDKLVSIPFMRWNVIESWGESGVVVTRKLLEENAQHTIIGGAHKHMEDSA